MNWNMVSALAEIVGVIAVVVSLIFVGREVRHNNALERAEAYRADPCGPRRCSRPGPRTTHSCMLLALASCRAARLADLSADAWECLKGAYADDFAQLVEERFHVHGHMTSKSPSESGKTNV